MVSYTYLNHQLKWWTEDGPTEFSLWRDWNSTGRQYDYVTSLWCDQNSTGRQYDYVSMYCLCDATETVQADTHNMIMSCPCGVMKKHR